MKLIYQPLKPFILGQGFGEQRACISLDGTNKIIGCDGNNPPPGYRSLYGVGGHTGIDVGAKHGQEVYCAQDGVVYHIDTSAKSGLDVRVQSYKHGVKFRHIYEHLMGYQPKVGDTLKAGELIGWADNTGYSSGDHLHFQMEIFENDTWKKVDPMLYMEPIFAKDALAMYHTILYVKEVIAKLADTLATKLRSK